MFITEDKFEKMESSNLILSNSIKIKDNILYKRIWSTFKRDNIINIYKKKNNKVFDGYVMPEKLLYTYFFNFFGYTMIYYKSYITFDQLISQKSDNFEKQIIISKKIISLFKQLISESFVYSDVHGGNIIVKDMDVKIVDVDSIISEQLRDPFFYKNDEIDQCARVTEIIFKYLLGTDDLRMIGKLDNILSKEFLYYIKACIKYDSAIIYSYVDEYIDELDEEKVKYMKNELFKIGCIKNL